MSESERWVTVAEYGATYEAEFAAGILREAEIPAMVRGAETGIFGPGFAGPTPRGASVLVPADYAGRARALLAEGIVGDADFDSTTDSPDE